MKPITIDNQTYKVIENLGYSHTHGAYAKVVLVDGVERVVVGQGSCWRFLKPIEKIQIIGPMVGQ